MNNIEDNGEGKRKEKGLNIERQKRERWEKIRQSRYNKWYERIKGEGAPGYSKKGWREK